MTKKIHDEQDKRDAVATFEGMGKGMKAAKQVAADYGVHYTTIYGWAAALSKPTVKAAKTVKAKSAPKPKKNNATQSKNGTKPTIADYDDAFRKYLRLRDEMNAAWQELTNIVEQMR